LRTQAKERKKHEDEKKDIKRGAAKAEKIKKETSGQACA